MSDKPELAPEVSAYLNEELTNVRASLEELRKAEALLRVQPADQMGRISGLIAAQTHEEAKLCAKLGLPGPPVRPLVSFKPLPPETA